MPGDIASGLHGYYAGTFAQVKNSSWCFNLTLRGFEGVEYILQFVSARAGSCALGIGSNRSLDGSELLRAHLRWKPLFFTA